MRAETTSLGGNLFCSLCVPCHILTIFFSITADKYGIELTFFHGKGGTVGRGGNPALYRAILSHPPNTINGRFRVTEQGEMIRQNFGSLEIAQRSLDIYTAALLRESFVKRVEPKKEWRDQMQRVSEVSCAAYRHTVREDPRFVPYFRQATPELELGRLNIGSRPAKRNPKGGVESLRAIPWTFAWAQTRMHLSAWLGVGAGLNGVSINRFGTQLNISNTVIFSYLSLLSPLCSCLERRGHESSL